MVTQELLEYISGQIKQEKDPNEIRSVLRGQGWTEDDLDSAFNQVTQKNDVFEKVIETEEKKNKFNQFNFKEYKWYEWLALLPALILLYSGGGLGALIGFLSWNRTLSTIRHPLYSVAKKIFLTILINILLIILYIALAILISYLIEKYL
jgi:hypothetical protein